MSGEDLIQACLDELRADDDAGAVRHLARNRGTALLATPGVAFALVVATLDGPEPDRCLELFELLIGDARMDAENRGRLGDAFLDEAATTIELLISARGLDPPAAHGLMLAYARAEAAAPEALILCMIRQFGALQDSGRIPLDPDEEIDRLRPGTGGNDYLLYLALNDRIAVLPADAQAAFVNDVSLREDDFCDRLALYWLLDRDADIRLAAAGGLYDRAGQGNVEPATAGLLPIVRNWMPPDSARPVVDAALREARRRDLFAPLERPAPRRERLLATLPDGNGVQTLTASLESGDEPIAALVQTRSGQGIASAFVVSGAAAREAVSTQEEQFHPLALPLEAFNPLLGAALAEGLAAEHPPPAGLIDVALACGITELRPQPMTAADWLAGLDPEGDIAGLPERRLDELILHSGTWLESQPMTRTWAEGTALLDDALDGASGPEQLWPAFLSRVEERRDAWAMLMLRAAHVLKAGGVDDWRSFAATGSALLHGRALRAIPIMGYVFDATSAAWNAENSPR